MTNRLGIIYVIRNTLKLSGAYVGQTIKFEERMRRHIRALSNGTHSSPKLQASWNKYGAESFSFEVLESGIPVGLLLTKREQFYIDQIGTFNHAPAAGSPAGVIHSAQARANMSAALKGRKLSLEHRENLRKSWIGRIAPPLSSKHKMKIAMALSGRTRPEEVRMKISRSKMGIKFSPEHRANIGLASKGRRLSQRTRSKMSASRAGKLKSKEWRIALSRSAILRSTPQYRAKISLAMKKVWLNRRKESSL